MELFHYGTWIDPAGVVAFQIHLLSYIQSPCDLQVSVCLLYLVKCGASVTAIEVGIGRLQVITWCEYAIDSNLQDPLSQIISGVDAPSEEILLHDSSILETSLLDLSIDHALICVSGIESHPPCILALVKTAIENVVDKG